MAAKKFQYKFRVTSGPNREDLFLGFQLNKDVFFRIFLDPGNEKIINTEIMAIKINYNTIATQDGYYSFYVYGSTCKHDIGIGLFDVKFKMKYDTVTHKGIISFY